MESTEVGSVAANAFMKEGVAGRTTLFVNAEARPQVLHAVTEDAPDPPATNAKAPSGGYDTAVGGRGESNLSSTTPAPTRHTN